ncbi:hypothetical protein JCM15519_10220 [Fundidesulfovibrio butyratiphilus]
MADTNIFPRYGDSFAWDAVDTWHAELTDPRGDRGLAAELRRCRTPDQALVTRAFQRLWRVLGAPKKDGRPDTDLALRLGLACAALAHVRDHDPKAADMPALLGRPRPGQSEARMVLARFRRLLGLEAWEPDKLLAGFVRAVRLAGEPVGVKSLTRAALYWDDNTRRDWTFQYYGQSSPATTSDKQ